MAAWPAVGSLRWHGPLADQQSCVGKSVLAQRLLKTEGIPWLPTDVLRTVLRRVLPELDAVDQGPVDAAQLAELMYPTHRTSGRGMRRGSRAVPDRRLRAVAVVPAQLQAALVGTTVRSCFLGHRSFSADDLASYRGPKPQH